MAIKTRMYGANVNGAMVNITGLGSGPDTSIMVGGGVLRFQPWITLESAGAAQVREVICPPERYLNGQNAANYHVQVEVSYCSGCTLYLESSPTFEGPWNEVTSFASSTDTAVVISSEAGSSRFSGLVRWRVAGTAPWQTCFHLKAVPGVSVTKYIGTPQVV